MNHKKVAEVKAAWAAKLAEMREQGVSCDYADQTAEYPLSTGFDMAPHTFTCFSACCGAKPVEGDVMLNHHSQKQNRPVNNVDREHPGLGYYILVSTKGYRHKKGGTLTDGTHLISWRED